MNMTTSHEWDPEVKEWVMMGKKNLNSTVIL
jgi:hypothetical protein